LLSDYSNLALEPDGEIDAPDAEPLRLETASQVHKLRSVSGMVGAEKIQQLAAQAEKTLRSEGDPAKQVLVELALALQELQQASTEALEAWRKEKFDGASPQGNATSLTLETVQHILGLLAEQDLDALEAFDEHSPSFREALGDERFQTLQESLAKLNYKEAISIITPLSKTLGTT
jgi:HPt (histidine-containing phosphotransfer) domain-containing protein